MSADEKQGETDAEYLTRRGWIDATDDDWTDPITTEYAKIAGAIAIQRARDEQEERAAWVQFAAHPTMEWLIHQGRPAEHYGDYMLAEYRVRFARKVARD